MQLTDTDRKRKRNAKLLPWAVGAGAVLGVFIAK
jgi:predicted nucleic acid-binding Zn ribbon protein